MGGGRLLQILFLQRWALLGSIQNWMSWDEEGGWIAIPVNTVPAAFWLILHVYSHPGLFKWYSKRSGFSCGQEDSRQWLGSISWYHFTEDQVSSFDFYFSGGSPLSIIGHLDSSGNAGYTIRRSMASEKIDAWFRCRVVWFISIPLSGGLTLTSSIQDISWKMKNEKPKRPIRQLFRHLEAAQPCVLAIISLPTKFWLWHQCPWCSTTWYRQEAHGPCEKRTTRMLLPSSWLDTDVKVEVSIRNGFDGSRWIYDLRGSDEIFARSPTMVLIFLRVKSHVSSYKTLNRN